MTKLRQVLDDRGLKHGRVAQLAEVRRDTFSGFVTGRIRPNREDAQRIGQVLEVDYLTLWPELKEEASA